MRIFLQRTKAEPYFRTQNSDQPGLKQFLISGTRKAQLVLHGRDSERASAYHPLFGMALISSETHL